VGRHPRPRPHPVPGLRPSQYVNVQYPWDGHEQIDPGRVPQDYNPVASYVRGFTLPGPPPDGERIVFRANRHEFGARGAS